MIEFLLKIYVIIISFYLGSFFVLVGTRIPRGESIFKPRSHCNNCGSNLKWYDLIPIFSYINLKGKCRFCEAKIGLLSFITEVLTPIFFILVIFTSDFELELLIGLIFLSLLIIVSISDIMYKIVPDSVLFLFFMVLLILRIFIHPEGLINYFLGAIVGFIFLFLIAYFGLKIYKKPVLGGGDIKLYAVIGLVVGYQNVFLSLFLASFLGSLVGLTLMQFKVISKNDYIPFVPFIALGTLITYLYSDYLIEWYLHLFI